MLGASQSEARERTRERSGTRPDRRSRESVMSRYPHQLSGGHAAARRDRDGAREGSCAPDPRRADDRARRDGRGRGARPRLAAAVGARHRRALHQPQPRCHLEDVLARGRALRRPSRRGRAGRDGAAGSAPPVHGRPPALHPARRGPEGSRSARHDPGIPPRHSGRSSSAACSPIAARSPTSAVTDGGAATRHRRRAATRAAAGTTSAHATCRARRPPTSSSRRRPARPPARRAPTS